MSCQAPQACHLPGLEGEAEKSSLRRAGPGEWLLGRRVSYWDQGSVETQAWSLEPKAPPSAGEERRPDGKASARDRAGYMSQCGGAQPPGSAHGFMHSWDMATQGQQGSERLLWCGPGGPVLTQALKSCPLNFCPSSHQILLRQK